MKQDECTVVEQRTAGQVMNISGPDSIRAGSTVPLTITVDATSQFCIQRAEAVIDTSYQTSVYVGANLVYSGGKGDGCPCFVGKKIYTLVYFTPATPGTYNIGFDATNWTPDSTFKPYNVTVY